MKNNARGLKI